MRKIKEILRLKHDLNYSQQTIADSTGVARSTVRDYLGRAKAAGLVWPLSDDMTNEKLNDLLFPVDANKSSSNRAEPDWSQIHNQLKRKAVTLQLLWEEYKRDNPNGYQYSWFAYRYRIWAKKFNVWMPQVHKAGDKAFVDYSGLTIPIWSKNFQEVESHAEVFVGVLGASDLIFAHATQTQQLADWVNAHTRMLNYYGGVPAALVPDNLRSAVSKAHRYEPACNQTYEEFAQHYGCAVMPARAYKPQDKSKVEKSVQLVQQRILAPLRDHKFTSLNEANEKIAKLLEDLNNRHSKTFACSRRELFNQVEREALRELPETNYELSQWQQIKLNGGYHVCVNRHYYSVPYQYVYKHVDVRLTAHCVEIFYKDDRIACHQRDDSPGDYTTVNAHRPEAHRQQAQWNAKRLKIWAASVGQYTQSLIHNLFDEPKQHLHQKERRALGILRLSHAYSEEMLEQACQKALAIGTCRYESVESLLKRDNLIIAEDGDHSCQTPKHTNVRGPEYYH